MPEQKPVPSRRMSYIVIYVLACSRLSVVGDEPENKGESKNEGGLRRGWKGRERACKSFFNDPLPAPALFLMRCRKLKMSTCQLAENAFLLSELHDSRVS